MEIERVNRWLKTTTASSSLFLEQGDSTETQRLVFFINGTPEIQPIGKEWVVPFWKSLTGQVTAIGWLAMDAQILSFPTFSSEWKGYFSDKEGVNLDIAVKIIATIKDDDTHMVRVIENHNEHEKQLELKVIRVLRNIVMSNSFNVLHSNMQEVEKTFEGQLINETYSSDCSIQVIRCQITILQPSDSVLADHPNAHAILSLKSRMRTKERELEAKENEFRIEQDDFEAEAKLKRKLTEKKATLDLMREETERERDFILKKLRLLQDVDRIRANVLEGTLDRVQLASIHYKDSSELIDRQPAHRKKSRKDDVVEESDYIDEDED